MTPQATLRIRVPALVNEPRGAVAAAALMFQLLRVVASVTAAVMASAKGRVLTAKVVVPRD